MTKHNGPNWEAYRGGLWRNANDTSRGADLEGQTHDSYRAEAVELVDDLAEVIARLDSDARGDTIGSLVALMRTYVPAQGPLADAIAGLSDAAREALWTMDGRTGGPVGGLTPAPLPEPAADPDGTEPAIAGIGDDPLTSTDDPIAAAVSGTRKRLRKAT